jgi:hypothetical protein
VAYKLDLSPEPQESRHKFLFFFDRPLEFANLIFRECFPHHIPQPFHIEIDRYPQFTQTFPQPRTTQDAIPFGKGDRYRPRRSSLTTELLLRSVTKNGLESSFSRDSLVFLKTSFTDCHLATQGCFPHNGWYPPHIGARDFPTAENNEVIYMNTSISILAEIPESLHQSLQQYLDDHPTWDQDRVFTAALAFFLLERGFPQDPNLDRPTVRPKVYSSLN